MIYNSQDNLNLRSRALKMRLQAKVMRLQAKVMISCLLVCIGSAGGVVKHQKNCSPSSCGQLQDIRYPFRLKDDLPKCGDPIFELTCDHNRTIIDLISHKYYVKSISYANKSIQIVDTIFAGGCPVLPYLHTYSEPRSDDRFYYTERTSIACFVNCTRKIESIKNRPVPCLSGNNAFVYVVLHGYLLADLAPSCRFLAQVNYDSFAGREEQILELLQEGFHLTWDTDTNTCISPSSMIASCLVEPLRVYGAVALLSYQQNFLSCLCALDFNNCHSYSTCKHGRVLFVLIDVLLLGLLGRIVFSSLTIFGLLAYKFRETRVPIDAVEKFLRNQQSITPKRYTYPEIIIMTRHFKEKLGQGGFGSVYKGELLGGFQVAVKILGNSKCNGDDFISEVSTIGRIHHVNVVTLVGFSSEGSKRALVYEYLPKGSLDKYIFSSQGTTQRPFTWDKLIDIAVGVARGIDYLHWGCHMRILHFDIKPHNILLDNSFNPKVSDFGLAKLFPRDYSIVALSAARGTIGYIAPEQISRSFGVISYKADVYSFGMLLMEMAGGRRNVEPKAENSSQIYYPSWIYDQLDEHMKVHGTIVNDVTAVGDVEKKLSIVGLHCIQTRPSDRPNMSRVVEMLQAEVGTLQMPPKPFLSSATINTSPIRDPSTESSYTTLSVISEH